MVAAAKSSNVTDDVVKSTIDIINTEYSTCKGGGLNLSKIKINGECINEIEVNQTIIYKGLCISDTKLVTNIQQQLDVKIKEKATSTAESAFGGGISSAEASNLIDSITKFAIEVKNEFNKSCIVTNANISNIEINCGDPSSVEKFRKLLINQNIEDISKCILTNSAINDAKAKIQKDFDQVATTSATASLPWWIIIVIIVVIIIIIIIIVVIIVFAR